MLAYMIHLWATIRGIPLPVTTSLIFLSEVVFFIVLDLQGHALSTLSFYLFKQRGLIESLKLNALTLAR
jgi:hypothetical protein